MTSHNTNNKIQNVLMCGLRSPQALVPIYLSVPWYSRFPHYKQQKLTLTSQVIGKEFTETTEYLLELWVVWELGMKLSFEE